MNRFSSTKDMTDKQAPQGGGMRITRLALCGHHAKTTGALMRGNLMLLCAECRAKKDSGK